MSSVDPNALLRAVDEVFEGVPPPAGEDIVSHACDECWELRDWFASRSTEQLRAEGIDPVRWDLPLLSANAKRAYLPLWLRTAIEDPASDEADALLFALDSDHRWDPDGGYSEAQLAVIGDYLALCVERLPVSGTEIEAAQLDRALTRWMR